jgi:arabinose-5-phosphate isomerase
MKIKREIKKVFQIEIDALLRAKSAVNADFENAVELLLDCKGKFIISGIGKSGLIG